MGKDAWPMSDLAERTLERAASSGDREATEKLQDIKCRRSDHSWVEGEEIAKGCGCPMDPGIHKCHPRVCDWCDLSEEDTLVY